MNLKKWKGIYEEICWDRALVLRKKNLPGRGLTKVEKHCSIRWVRIALSICQLSFLAQYYACELAPFIAGGSEVR